jgi:hypothetical protein
MSCLEGREGFESNCKGMHMFRDNRKVIIEDDSCLNDCYKVIYRNTREFPDKSFLIYDEILICADGKLLMDISDVIRKEFGD